MATKLPATDVVTIDLGWTGSILPKSMTEAGLRTVSIERGPWRDTATDFPPSYSPDELRYAVRLDLFARPAQTTLTFRNVHWNAETWRFLPADFVLKTHLTQRYGAK